jgi:hypothetical protein
VCTTPWRLVARGGIAARAFLISVVIGEGIKYDGMDWIQMYQNRINCKDFVNMAINIRVPQK